MPDYPSGLLALGGLFGQGAQPIMQNFAAAQQQQRQQRQDDMGGLLDIARLQGQINAQDFERQQFAAKQAAAQKEADARGRYAQGLNPQQRALYEAAPDQFATQAAEAAFATPDPSKRYMELPDGRVLDISGEAPRVAYEAPQKPQQPQYENVDGVWYQTNAQGGPRPVQGQPGGGAPKPKTGEITTLRKEYAAESAPFSEIRQRFKNIVAAEDSTTGDTARVFSLIKMLDPTSTVSPGEQATVNNAGGIDGQIMGLYNHLLAGGNMSAAKRQQILQQAAALYQGRYQDQISRFEAYGGIADRFGMRRDDVLSGVEITPLESMMPQQPKATPAQRKNVQNLTDTDLDAMSLEELEALQQQNGGRRQPDFVGAIPQRPRP